MHRIGYLTSRSKPSRAEKAFWQALREIGYVEGRNIVIERRSANRNLDRFPELAAELVRKKVDVIVVTSVQGALAAKKATKTIPVVFAIAQEPVGVGLVASLAQPGGNVTGMTDFAQFPICKPEPLANLFRANGLLEVETRALDAPTIFTDFNDYWSPFLLGHGPAGAYCVGLSEDDRELLRRRLESTLPVGTDGTIQLVARAWAVRGITP
jgi:hypothetical protein